MGPFNMNPGDTQSVIIAQIIARGSNNLHSISLLKASSDYIQSVYNQNFHGFCIDMKSFN